MLVGDFSAVDDVRAQQLLKRIKGLEPDALKTTGSKPSAQSLSEVRQFHNRVFARRGRGQSRGPMAKAFLVPNPLLPREFFVAKGVDDFVAKMNKGLKYSLLDCPGKYTVQVATFRGSSVLQTSSAAKRGGLFGRRQQEPTNSLVAAAENAHLLAAELRKHKYDAYVFHDRDKSIVTVGSFDRAARKLPNGRVVPTQAAQRVIETFGAAYPTPADPLLAVGEDPTNRQRRDLAIRQVSVSLSSNAGQIAAGLNPKHVKILKRKELVRTIPIDIHPHLIEVPRRSISSAYMRR